MRNEKALTIRDVEQSINSALLRALQPKQKKECATLSPEARKRRADTLRARMKALLISTKDEKRKDRITRRLMRVEKTKLHIQKDVMRLTSVYGCCRLSEVKFKPYRNLSEQEMRVNFEEINNEYSRLQTSLEDELSITTREEIDRALQNAKNKLDSGDVAGIALILFLFRERVREIIVGSIKDSYRVGKDLTSDEISVVRPTTPLEDTQIMNMEADDVSEAYASNLENTLKSSIREGLMKGAGVAAILAFARDTLTEEAAKNITNISGTTVGQYINNGRNMVLQKNVSKIHAFLRSEILDGRTCNMCLAIDELVVSPTDPMSRMSIVHTHCRGQWVPILLEDDVKPDVTGIPASISNRFEKVDGVPVINAFKQIKKPIGDLGKETNDAIKKRLS